MPDPSLGGVTDLFPTANSVAAATGRDSIVVQTLCPPIAWFPLCLAEKESNKKRRTDKISATADYARKPPNMANAETENPGFEHYRRGLSEIAEKR